MQLVKYLREITGKASFLDLLKRVGLYSFVDGNVAQTAMVHGPRAHGVLVGTDGFGNKYYERLQDEQYGRHRWVVYADLAFPKYDASAVPPEWHGWLHFITDDAPTRVPPEIPHFLVPHAPSMTGTDGRYLPKGSWFNERKMNWQKVEYWQPPGS